jgi:hypothetical protein
MSAIDEPVKGKPTPCETLRRRAEMVEQVGLMVMVLGVVGGTIVAFLPDDAGFGETTRPYLAEGFILAGVALVHDDVEAVAVLLDALRARVDLPGGRIRVAVRIALDIPADRTRTSLAERLGVDAPSIIMGRAGADAPRALELRVDVRDATAAHLVRAWREGRQLDVAVGSA